MKYKEFDKEKASKRCCELLREHFLDEEEVVDNSEVIDDNWIIKRYTDEWSWFMQGWMECVNFQP